MATCGLAYQTGVTRARLQSSQLERTLTYLLRFALCTLHFGGAQAVGWSGVVQ